MTTNPDLELSSLDSLNGSHTTKGQEIHKKDYNQNSEDEDEIRKIIVDSFK